jgi:hypothetical protein
MTTEGIKAGYSTPLMHVAEVERSIRFYELLGFELMDSDRCVPIGWARMHCEGGAVMFLRAEEPVDGSKQSVMLVMYTPDLVGLREHLLANGVAVPPIGFPGYAPAGNFAVGDPDDYRVEVLHWGKKEHEEWEKQIGRKA